MSSWASRLSAPSDIAPVLKRRVTLPTGSTRETSTGSRSDWKPRASRSAVRGRECTSSLYSRYSSAPPPSCTTLCSARQTFGSKAW